MMDLRDNAERMMVRKYPILIFYAISLYLYIKTNKWYFNQDHMVQKSMEDFLISFKICYL